jgi:uncharacterized protein YcaQ
VEISRQTARRFLLGRSGLWPGRRWSGKDGAASAVRTLGGVQIDPINVVGRSHDLVLQARVQGYRPQDLEELAYVDRRFFDYGLLLFLHPMEDLPYWRLHMRRRADEPRWRDVGIQHAATIARVRDELRERGPLGNRDFKDGKAVEAWGVTRDTGLALQYLWVTGELMTHGRVNFQRRYGFLSDIAPPEAARIPSKEATEAFFAAKTLRRHGLATRSDWAASMAYYLCQRDRESIRQVRLRAPQDLARLTDEGAAAMVRVEGLKEPYYLPADELELLEACAAGGVPGAWQTPAGPAEAIFLAPLDDIVRRERAKMLFDFEYLWEVYKPAPLRRWGYYVLPVLWADRLVARVDFSFDRKSRSLAVNGFWPEDPALLQDTEFAGAFRAGLARFLDYLGGGAVSTGNTEVRRLLGSKRRARSAVRGDGSGLGKT